jgi:hypothetical protein
MFDAITLGMDELIRLIHESFNVRDRSIVHVAVDDLALWRSRCERDVVRRPMRLLDLLAH